MLGKQSLIIISPEQVIKPDRNTDRQISNADVYEKPMVPEGRCLLKAQGTDP